jgi:phosphatidylserine/phosphatidylglycerophosphate/cardiolipin synthase-like enzyme
MINVRLFLLLTLIIILSACASPGIQQCEPGTQNLPDCPPAYAVNDEAIKKIYAERTWTPPSELTIDPIEFGEQAEIPINRARTKVLGPSQDDAVRSLAAKLWLIENAEHTVDVMYYIFARDKVGYAILGALCNAVKRGVDVRMMVDSLGSFHPSHSELRALETCAQEAGFMRNADGKVTTTRARVQVVIFNSIAKFQFNRRSHDKLLVVDGGFPSKAAVMTGGRNVSLHYYGLNADGSEDPTAYRDLEILLRVDQQSKDEKAHVGRVTEYYYTLLFLHKGNRRLRPLKDNVGSELRTHTYKRQREKSQESLAFLKKHPQIRQHLDDMPQYMNQDFHNSKVRLSHQLGNLEGTEVSTHAKELIEKNPNSIMYLIAKLEMEAKKSGEIGEVLRVISPYLFVGKYKDANGNVIYDGVKEVHDFLHDHPEVRLEIIMNSVMTGDNIFTQAIIDMDMVPRLLLTPELQEAWLSDLEEGEFNPAVVESDKWKKLVMHPQIFVYQTGGLDSVELGKDKNYGKLHAKFIVGENVGFVGTSNFDYRSNLHNNEMGFFYQDDDLRDDLIKQFDILKAASYRWGSPEWLQMRRELMESDSKKAGAARRQRGLYKKIRFLGVEYLM